MKIVIVGCGRVGATLATQLDKVGHAVTVIDNNSDAFQRLDTKFTGKKILGNGADDDVLKHAGIERADAFVAVTNGDNRNIMASQIAKEIFHVKKVLCRIYDPLRQSTYKDIGLETICPTIVSSDILFKALSE